MPATLIQHGYVGRLVCDSLQTQLGSSPISPLRVVPDFMTSFHANPLGEWDNSVFVSWPGIA